MKTLALLLVFLVVGGGCAIRMGESEHFVGPMAFRYGASEGARAEVVEVLRFGLAADAGEQWGVALGVVNRVAVMPHAPDHGAGYRWTLPLQTGEVPTRGPWHMSWLYARLDGVRPAHLVRRVVYGAEATTGPEARALSLGVTSRLLIHAPSDAVSLVRFNARFPLASRIIVWLVRDDDPLPTAEILEEVQR
jgi:hypothetical protein